MTVATPSCNKTTGTLEAKRMLGAHHTRGAQNTTYGETLLPGEAGSGFPGLPMKLAAH
jgi:hypothetical protein